VAQRNVEIVIGRLITDEEFRARFIADPEATLAALSETGCDLSRTEVAALLTTNNSIWQTAADAIDPRLQKASLQNQRR
jgi:hypothetical protein